MFVPAYALTVHSFSALQRAEIAEMGEGGKNLNKGESFSALQRAEIAEIVESFFIGGFIRSFSALQRAEIAEIGTTRTTSR